MKKILSVLLVALLALPMSAQVYRNGNTYFAEGQTMKKNDFAAYMQQNAEAQLALKFQDGLKLSKVGWGLFGAGLGVELTGMICSTVGTATVAKNGQAAKVTPVATAGVVMYLIGSGAVTASIVCLGVGYARMHNSADAYSVYHNREKPQAYLSVKADGNGLGLALNF